ncbi:MAG: phosphoglucosamine mutase [Oscillospiraceae bacterium]|nr:phosphoglucosamine mutase [Oscillospiraceae bacterium]
MDRLFGTEGVTGTAVTELTCELVMSLGRALVNTLTKKLKHKITVFIGRDTRKSSDLLESALTAGICSAGADVCRLGVVPAAAVAYLVKINDDADAGIMISSPGNGFEINGLKFYSSTGYRISDDMEDEIQKTVSMNGANSVVSGNKIGTATDYNDAQWDYLRYMLKTARAIVSDFTGVRVVIDTANGSGCTAAENLFSALGARCFMINNQPDGVNINDKCGISYIGSLSKTVRSKRADVGLSFDSDTGRCIVIDENGDILDGDKIMAVIALDAKNNGTLKKDAVVVTSAANIGFNHFAAANRICVRSSKSGEKYIMEKLLDGGYVLGGEPNGRLLYPEESTTSDGLLTGIRILSIIKKTGIKISKLASVMEQYPQVMMNVCIPPHLKEIWKNNSEITDLIERRQKNLGSNGRIIVRENPSESVISVIAEGKNFEEINGYVIEITDVIKKNTKINSLE